MILAKATLVSGPCHTKYPADTSLPAILFINAKTEDAAEQIASRQLLAMGWSKMTIERYKDVSDYSQFEGTNTPESAAFQDAISSGFALVVYP